MTCAAMPRPRVFLSRPGVCSLLDRPAIERIDEEVAGDSLIWRLSRFQLAALNVTCFARAGSGRLDSWKGVKQRRSLGQAGSSTLEEAGGWRLEAGTGIKKTWSASVVEENRRVWKRCGRCFFCWHRSAVKRRQVARHDLRSVVMLFDVPVKLEKRRSTVPSRGRGQTGLVDKTDGTTEGVTAKASCWWAKPQSSADTPYRRIRISTCCAEGWLPVRLAVATSLAGGGGDPAVVKYLGNESG